MIKRLLSRSAAEKGRWSDKRLQVLAEIFGVMAIVALLSFGVGGQLAKWGQRVESEGLLQWVFWGDLTGALGIVLAVAAIAPVTLRRFRGWILEDEPKRSARIPEIGDAATKAVVAAAAGVFLLLFSRLLGVPTSRSGQFAEAPAAFVNALADVASAAGFLIIGAAVVVGLAAAVHRLAHRTA